MEQTESRFVARELTVQEMIYFNKGGKGDFESEVLFVESRLVDKIFNVRGLAMSEWRSLIDECVAATTEAIKTTAALNGGEGQSRKAPMEQVESMISRWGKDAS